MTERPNPFAGRTLGFLFLCFFLVVFGVLRITNITFVAAPYIEGGLALVSGILLLLGY